MEIGGYGENGNGGYGENGDGGYGENGDGGYGGNGELLTTEERRNGGDQLGCGSGADRILDAPDDFSVPPFLCG